MGAARMVMTMAVIAIGGGGLLAIATIPALAPYQQGKVDRGSLPVYVPRPELAPETPAASDYGLASPQEDASSDPELGLSDGAVVIELPRWAQDGGEWLTLGRRAWRDWVEPGDDGYAANPGEPAYGDSERRGWDQRDPDRRDWGHRERGQRSLGQRDRYEYGQDQEYERQEYGQHYGAEPDRRWRDDGDEDEYGGQQRWSSPVEPRLPPLAQPPSAYADATPRRRDPGVMRQDTPSPPADAAANAAERARQAARDVRAAEGVQ